MDQFGYTIEKLQKQTATYAILSDINIDQSKITTDTNIALYSNYLNCLILGNVSVSCDFALVNIYIAENSISSSLLLQFFNCITKLIHKGISYFGDGCL